MGGEIEETVTMFCCSISAIAQRVFESVEQVPVNADAAGQEYAFRNGKHSPPAAALPLAIATDRAVAAKDIVSGIANFHDQPVTRLTAAQQEQAPVRLPLRAELRRRRRSGVERHDTAEIFAGYSLRGAHLMSSFKNGIDFANALTLWRQYSFLT